VNPGRVGASAAIVRPSEATLSALALLALLAACTSDPGDPDDTGDPTDTGDTADSDTGDTVDTDTGTDADGDGWSVERGDCDDADVWKNPGHTDRADDRDNDCDGLVDERFDAVVAFQVDTAGAQTSRVHRVDLLGSLDGTWDLAGGPAAATSAPWVADRPADTGWWLVSAEDASVFALSPTGVATLAWSAGTDATLDPPVTALYGAAALPDGSAVVTSGDRLFTVTEAGVATAIASWNPEQLWGYAVAVDPRDGSIALFGAYGGLATWSSGAGLAILRNDDGLAPPAVILDAVADEQGRVYALGDVLDGASYVRGVYAWDRQGTDLELVAPWVDSHGDPILFAPSSLAMDTEADEFYVTANAAWFRTVWRVFPEQDYASVLWPDANVLEQVPPPEDEHRFVRGVGIRWTHDAP